ncbi:hypothetical protein HK405_012783 [Cladochytrium tenue]|nr:hypothetical protein HK405_012783 [Cladochytrium tenue]
MLARLASSSSSRARPVVAAAALGRRNASTSVFAWAHLKTFLPPLKVESTTTLGEIYDQVYGKYRYRLAYPVLLYGGYLWWNLWTPYISKEEKEKIKEHEDRLGKLEFRQD